MKKVIVLLLACLFMFFGCAGVPSGDMPTETSTIKEQPTGTETEPVEETEPEEDPYFGFTKNEIDYLLEVIKNKNIPCTGVSDLMDVQCIGYHRKLPTTPGGVGEWDYNNIEYGVCTKRGLGANLCIPVELLEEWNVDINERVK